MTEAALEEEPLDLDTETSNDEQSQDTTNETSNQQSQDSQEPVDDKEKNWKAFLEKRKQETAALQEEKEKNRKLLEEQKRKDEEFERMKNAFEAALSKTSKSNDDDDFDKKEEDNRRKLVQEEVNRILETQNKEKQEKERQEQQKREIQQIYHEMPDIQEVMSSENIAYLEYYYPEIAVPIGKLPDGLEKTKLAYNAIRKHVKNINSEKEKIEKNLSKPKSVHSSLSNESQNETSDYVMSNAKKEQVWNKMQRLMSGLDED